MNGLNWRTRALLVGGVVGALFGVVAARLYVNAMEQTADRESGQIQFNPAEVVGIGLAALGVLRQIATLHEPKSRSRR